MYRIGELAEISAVLFYHNAHSMHLCLELRLSVVRLCLRDERPDEGVEKRSGDWASGTEALFSRDQYEMI